MLSQVNETFSKYPDSSKTWIFSCSRKISEEELPTVSVSISKFLSSWKRHGKKVKASFEILLNQFIVVISEETDVQATGCSQDVLFHFMESPVQLNDFKILAFNSVSYETENGDIKSLTHRDFVKCLQRNQVFTKETLVFDTTIHSTIPLKENKFKLKLKDSWHNDLYELNNQ